MELRSAVLVTALLCLALSRGASSQRAPIKTPAPAPRHVDLADLLSLAGPYGTFLGYLTKTDVIRAFQSLANDTRGQGITVFAPEDSAFAAVDKAALANLTADELRSLMLYHAMPKYYPLSAFSALAAASPVATLAGGQYTVNVTDAAGTIRVASSWATAKLASSVYSTPPVAVYALNRVLLPAQAFPTAPEVAPVPAPAPAPAPGAGVKASDGAPAPPGAAEHGAKEGHGAKSLSCRISAGRLLVGYLVLFAFGVLML